MRLTILVAAFALLTSHAIAGPVLVGDERVLTAFAHSIDAGGDGLADGPNMTSLGTFGGLYSDTVRADSSGGNFNAVSIAGADQLSFFEPDSLNTFNASGGAQVLTKARLGASQAHARSTNSIRLVFEVDAGSAFELAGGLGGYANGDATSGVRVTLRAESDIDALFEQTKLGSFATSGTLSEGRWVLELHAEASVFSSGSGLGDSSSGAFFQEVRFTLVPAPASLAPLALALAFVRRRRLPA